ncbi:hypothetical protein HDK64DRAFT_275778 [Phyllosticta capitalensis]
MPGGRFFQDRFLARFCVVFPPPANRLVTLSGVDLSRLISDLRLQVADDVFTRILQHTTHCPRSRFAEFVDFSDEKSNALKLWTPSCNCPCELMTVAGLRLVQNGAPSSAEQVQICQLLGSDLRETSGRAQLFSPTTIAFRSLVVLMNANCPRALIKNFRISSALTRQLSFRRRAAFATYSRRRKSSIVSVGICKAVFGNGNSSKLGRHASRSEDIDEPFGVIRLSQ